MASKYKVSNNAISVMKYLKYKEFSKEDFYEFIDGKIPVAILGLTDGKSKTNSLLKTMQSVVDELTEKDDNDIDYDYINKKLK